MSKKVLNQKYGKPVIAIHWVSALLILVLFPLGKYMSGLDPIEKLSLVRLHALLGAVVVLLTIVRSILFFTAQRPEHLNTGSVFNDKLAVAIHRSFYFLLLIIGTTGIVTLYAGGYIHALFATPMAPEAVLPANEIPSLKAHNFLSMLMMGLLALHIGGVVRFTLKHKTNVIKRIT